MSECAFRAFMRRNLMLDNDGKYYCEEEGCGRELCGDMVGSWFWQLCTFCFEEKEKSDE